MMLHQLQQDIADIRQALQVQEDMDTVMPSGMAVRRGNEQQCDSQPVGVSRWTRRVAEIQQAQGILQRLRQNRSLRGVVV
jgi:hypothetical protein